MAWWDHEDLKQPHLKHTKPYGERTTMDNGTIKALNEWAQLCYRRSEAKGFWNGELGMQSLPVHVELNKTKRVALLHSEVSELLEGIRKPGPCQKDPTMTLEEEELADIFIRLMDYCGGYDIDIDAAVTKKLAYNANRPHMHGKKF